MEHGGDLDRAMARYGGLGADWLDLSTGINPHAYPLPSIQHSCWQRLPSAGALDGLLTAARRCYAVPASLGVTAAPGTQAIISRLPTLLPSALQDCGVAVVSPTYGSHAATWRRAGKRVEEISNPFALPEDCRVLILVNPNNPDGRLIGVKSLLEIADRLAERDGLLIVDEAFADCMPGASVLALAEGRPVAVLRSFGKFYGLAGLRLGFLAGPAWLTQALQRSQESWAVSGPALAVGTAALSDTAWQSKMLSRLADEMADLNILLHERGLTVFGGTPLYALVAHPRAAALHEALAKRRVWTRIFDYAPTWMRLGLPGGAENLARFDTALREALEEA
ncbi:threonine-phosphate decarboxylase [Stappia sp. F7233]|uniref:threonine-phosphate decarboxylase n=1 Tax=Stappia albiluteola TaxID=2758565 RepID=A0A839AA62_9HYPH|nr:threonine-phosphate decarboxylase CobD [Stappia albiluteola]MBA5776453.1 threonine-phosphate decarboxylase [Stappia albiluteola]